MTRRSIIVVILVLAGLMAVGTPVWCEKAATLKEVMRPTGMSMGEGRLFITEGHFIYIYALKGYKLIKKIGKKGEGPGEFKSGHMSGPMLAIPHKGKLYVSSHGKVSEFSLDGEFLKENKVTPYNTFKPFGDQYVYSCFTGNENNKMVMAVNLADGKFQKVKELLVSGREVGMNARFEFPTAPPDFAAYKDRVYVVDDSGGFAVNVYDKTGKHLFRIKREHKPLKVSEETKKMHMEALQKDPNLKGMWEFMRTRIVFKEYYPPIRNMRVRDNRIHLLTFKKRLGKSQCLILDLKGKRLGEVYVTCQDNLGIDVYPKFACYKAYVYALMENEEDETWELHRTALK